MEVAMVGLVVGAVVNNVVAKLSVVIERRFSELAYLACDVSSIQTELKAIISTLDGLQKGQPIDLQREIMSEARELAFDIEDCLDKFLPCEDCGRGAGPIGSAVDFAIQVKKLKRRSKEVADLIQKHSTQATDDVAGPSAGTGALASRSSAAHLVGVEKPKQEIESLLGSENLAVISIVGFGGSGKTELARAVYNCPEFKKKFGLRSWVVASEHKDVHELLLSILKDLCPGEASAPLQEPIKVETFQQRIRNRMRREDTRCLIVIDDMIKLIDWDPIESFFSELTVKILLTTTLQPVAKKCTAKRGYIYNMRRLNDVDSRYLLKKMVHMFDVTSPDLARGLAAIVDKCHGHPLTLISVANYLISQGQESLDGNRCIETSSILCTLVDENEQDIFKELRRVLETNYNDLSSASIKRCLLYTSLFPNDRPLSSKTLTSRWLAEGYIGRQTQRSCQQVADQNMLKLMDRNIIQPTDADNSGKAKKCKPHGVMHQFMLYKSMSSNFIATSLIKGRNFRHLVIENKENGRVYGAVPDARPQNMRKKISTWFRKKFSKGAREELRLRSLAVFGSAEEAVYSDLLKCKLLRVLDLQYCNDSLSEDHHSYIYNLLHLRYLTLGRSVSNLSVQMKSLHCLKTLDLRKTGIQELPVVVITLPHLLHLFGKIKLQNISGGNRQRFKGGKNNLQTLAGVVVDDYSVFPELMHDMIHLSKVKIWCEITGTGTEEYAPLSAAIKKYIEANLNKPICKQSLSLHLNTASMTRLCLYHKNCQCPNTYETRSPNVDHESCGFLTELKLHGRPFQFRDFVKSLCGLTELCLTSINLNEEDLSALGTLLYLVFLKVVQDNLAGLHINSEGFKSLKRLCLVLKEPMFPTIAEEALPTLTSIQLLCGGLIDLGGFEMKNFRKLSEVALDSNVTANTVELWETAANNNPNKRPRIVFLERVDPANTRSAVKYVATDQIPSGTSLQESTTDQTQSGPPVQESTTDQTQSGPVQEIVIDQSILGSPVQGVTTNGFPSGPPVQPTA